MFIHIYVKANELESSQSEMWDLQKSWNW